MENESLVLTVLDLIGQLNFTAANDLLKKKTRSFTRAFSKGPNSVDEVANRLYLLEEAEGLYYRTSFGKSSKRDVLGIYLQLLGSLSLFPALIAADTTIAKMVDKELVQQLDLFTQLRVQLVTFYRTLASSASPCDYAQYILVLGQLEVGFVVLLDHPFMRRLQFNVRNELTLLQSLFRAQSAVSKHRLKESTIHMAKSKFLLRKWSADFAYSVGIPRHTPSASIIGSSSKSPSKSPESLAPASISSTPPPLAPPVIDSPLTRCNLFRWLTMLMQFTVSKSTLYFYPVLSEKESEIFGGDMKSLQGRVGADYLAWIESLFQFSQPEWLGIIYNTEGQPFERGGFEMPSFSSSSCSSSSSPPEGALLDLPAEPEVKVPSLSSPDFGENEGKDRGQVSSGLSAWPCTFRFPLEKDNPYHHWPNIISIISDKTEELDQNPQAFCLYDATMNCTYFICKIDLKAYLVLIYPGKKKNTDRLVQEFTTQTTAYLRNHQVFSALL